MAPPARITRLHARNYRSIEALTLDLDGTATVLVGPNGAGKSNIIDAVAFVSDALQLGLAAAISKRNGIDAIRRGNAPRDSHGYPSAVRIEVQIEISEQDGKEPREDFCYGFEIGGRPDGEWTVEYEFVSHNGAYIFERDAERLITGASDVNVDEYHLTLPALGGLLGKVREAIIGFGRFDIALAGLREPQPFNQAHRLTSNGDNLNHVWAGLQERYPHLADRIVELLRQITPNITRIRARSLGRFKVLEADFDVTAHQRLTVDSAGLSDGTLRALALLVAVHQPETASLIAVEEPEKALHPHAAELLFDALLSAETAPPLLISTHSPSILSSRHLDAARMIRVVEWRDGRTLTAPIASDLLKDVADRLTTAPELLTEGSLNLDESQTQHQSLRPPR